MTKRLESLSAIRMREVEYERHRVIGPNGSVEDTANMMYCFNCSCNTRLYHRALALKRDDLGEVLEGALA
jgi:hypothetical protein